ncbi:MAG: AgmX/PglI C-terminal domain-containing protein [Deltaproteobacteria bacterium]|nr:AgmX/PglI C-terminal domain-containing protein [Deltaproteobacteria bacterium]
MYGLFLACLMGIRGYPAPVAEPVRAPSAAVATALPAAAPPRQVSRADITQVVQRKMGTVRHCYEVGLREDPTLAGVVEVGWKIQVDGHVSSVNIVDATKHNNAIEDCLLTEIIRWEFPASIAPIVVGAYPFVLDASLLARRTAQSKPGSPAR